MLHVDNFVNIIRYLIFVDAIKAIVFGCSLCDQLHVST